MLANKIVPNGRGFRTHGFNVLLDKHFEEKQILN
jgi:hypothetical protein